MTDEQQETTGTGAVETEQPDLLIATGPDGKSDPIVERRKFANNVEAFDAKQEAAMAAQNAPNPTTDIDLAREAYGEDWNRRRGHKLIATASEDPDPANREGEGDAEALYDHGGSVVDNSGHVLGHTTDLGQAVQAKRRLGTDGELGRYPVTAEAQSEELRRANESGASADESKTLDGGLGAAVDTRAQNEHDVQVTEAKGEGVDPKPATRAQAKEKNNNS